jgi:hypothetical protein
MIPALYLTRKTSAYPTESNQRYCNASLAKDGMKNIAEKINIAIILNRCLLAMKITSGIVNQMGMTVFINIRNYKLKKNYQVK